VRRPAPGTTLPKLPSLPTIAVPSLPNPTKINLPTLPGVGLPTLPGTSTLKNVTDQAGKIISGLLGQLTAKLKQISRG
jgi:hypothetical protein